jgi:hypothetical protein
MAVYAKTTTDIKKKEEAAIKDAEKVGADRKNIEQYRDATRESIHLKN